MRIAVIGTGNVGGVLADKLAEKGHEVVVAASTADSAEEAARDVGYRAAGSPADALREVAAEIRPHVAGTPIVDVSNGPRAVQVGESLAEGLQAQLPEAHVVKAFNSAFASKMADPFDGDRPLDGFIAGNHDAAKQAVASLVRDVGFEPLDVGDLKNARTLEGMAWINISLNMENGWPWQSTWRLERN